MNQHFPYIYTKLDFLLTSSHISCWLTVFRLAELDEFHPRIREEHAVAISGMLFWATKENACSEVTLHSPDFTKEFIL